MITKTMTKIPQEIIDEIIDRTDIVNTISEYVPLKQAGRNFKSRCPFHDEKTASFVVSPDKQIFHCFGCGAGGNVIGFIMKYEQLGFRETISMLADRTGVSLPSDKGASSGDISVSEKIYKLNSAAASYYHKTLYSAAGKKALIYLHERGLTDHTIKYFMLGYAPDSWENLKNFFSSKRIPAALLRKAGLTSESRKNRGDYDRFRKRIIFPVYNERGKVSALAGRVIDDSLPKYINSPETEVYSKSNTLYGLNFSKQGIREAGYAVVVEGYMDVILPYQSGIKNIVAVSGTSFTSRQAQMLKKYTQDIVIVFDSDKAGEAASLRGLDILIEKGLRVKIARLPDGEDPDSLVRSGGPELFKRELNDARDLLDYKEELLLDKHGKNNLARVIDEILPTISKVPNAVLQSEYLKRLAESLSIHEASLRHEMKKVKPDYSYRHENNSESPKQMTKYKKSELHLLGLALLNRKNFDIIEEKCDPEDLTHDHIRVAFSSIRTLYISGEDKIKISKFLSRFDTISGVHEAVVKAISIAETSEDTQKALQDCIMFLKNEKKKEALRDLTGKLKTAQKQNNTEEVNRLLNKINTIHKQRVI
jgi:DNA primase